MHGKSPGADSTWIDPDDAPELASEFFERAEWRIGDRIVPPQAGQAAMRETIARGRPRSANPKVALTLRYDADVVAAFKSTGKGWQTRMNAALREWLDAHPIG